MAFQDVLDKIANDLIDNTDRLITPAVLRGVLNDIAQWAQDDKVDKVTGKGLSEEDFTTILLNKLNGIESGAQVNEVSASDLNNYIQKGFGIELRQNKGNFQAQSIVSSWNNIVGTGFYEGGSANVSDMPPFQDTRGAYVIHEKLGGGATVDYAIQIANSYDGEEMAFRSKDNGVWGDWQMILTAADYAILLNKINKLTIEDIDLSDGQFWDQKSKTLDLSTKKEVGILNFNTTFSAVGVTSITEAEVAVVTYANVSSAKLFQNDKLINFAAVSGGSPFTDLNTGDYMIKNIDEEAFTFELYESDGVTPVNTEKVTHANVSNVTIATEAVFTVDDPTEIFNGKLVETSGLGGLGALDGIAYEVQNLAGNEFQLFDPDSGSYVNTTGMTYSGGGTIVSAPYSSGGSIDFKDGIIDVNISKIIGLSNGKRMKYTVSEDNQIEFNKRSLSVATANEIVGSESLILEENKVFELLRNKGLNWIKSEFEAS